MNADPAGNQLQLGTCGRTARLSSYGQRTCTQPAGHRPPPDAPPTSTQGWHRSDDGISWATPEALTNRATALARPAARQ